MSARSRSIVLPITLLSVLMVWEPSGTAATPSCVSRADVAAWPTADRAANLVMVSVKVSQVKQASEFIKRWGVTGLLVRGLPTLNDAANIKSWRDGGRHGKAFMAVDEEGGRVQHLQRALGLLPSARQMAANNTPSQVRARAKAHGKAMAAMGFTMDFAPNADLEPTKPVPPTNKRQTKRVGTNGVGDRSWGRDPQQVIAYAGAFAEGLSEAGIMPILKHFPGHGNATGDTHSFLSSTPPLASMKTNDILPFASLLSNPKFGVMISHLTVPGLDSIPSTFSKRTVTELLRGELGVRGLVITDSLTMGPVARRYSAPEAAVMALKAGNDVLLFDDNPDAEAIIARLSKELDADPIVNQLAIDANLRVLTAKGMSTCEPLPVTPTTIVEEEN